MKRVFSEEAQNGISSLNQNKAAAPPNSPCPGLVFKWEEKPSPMILLCSAPNNDLLPPSGSLMDCSAQFLRQFLGDLDFIPTQNENKFQNLNIFFAGQNFPSQTYHTLLLLQIPPSASRTIRKERCIQKKPKSKPKGRKKRYSTSGDSG